MTNDLKGVTAGRDGCVSTAELLVEKSKLEAAWTESVESVSEPYSLDVGIRCKE